MAYSRNFDKKQYAEQQEQLKNELTDRINKLGESFELSPETILDYYSFAGKFYQYSSNNNKLIYSQNPYATFTGSFKFFKDKGYSVNKGEHGLKILVPVTITMFKIGENEWKKISEATPEEKKRVNSNELETKQIKSFKIGTVFDISQTNVPTNEYPKLYSVGYKSEQHAAIYDGVKNYCEAELNCPVELVNFDSISLGGHYIPALNKIELNDRLNDSRKLETLLHEMGHAVQHTVDSIKTMPLSQIEFEADSFGLMLQSHFGFEFSETQNLHLVNQYQELKSMTEKELGKDSFNVNNLLNSVCDKFYEHINTLSDYVKVELTKDRIKDIELRFRGSDEVLNRPLDDIQRETFEEANNYYENGKLYVIEKEPSPYICTRWNENGDEFIRFDPVHKTDKTTPQFLGVPETMGTFLPGVASRGCAIIRMDDMDNTNSIENYCSKIVAKNNSINNELEMSL